MWQFIFDFQIFASYKTFGGAQLQWRREFLEREREREREFAMKGESKRGVWIQG